MGPQVHLDLRGIADAKVSSGLRGRQDVKEIKATRQNGVQQVLWAPQVLEVGQVLQVFLVRLVLMVLQERRAAWDSEVLLDRWGFMDWMD